jgi:NAD(P)-dependent dehydrogenase (short-subunit alcohol dehydrogenase family)
MFAEFKDQVVLITGAAGGIGSALVSEFSRYEARVYRTDITDAGGPLFIQGDISDPGFIRRLLDHILEREGRMDILVNNAGICPRTNVLEISREEWQKVMDINLTSMFLLSQAVMEIMIRQKHGTIVNLSSIAGKNGGTTVGAHYSASKAAIECLTKTFAKTGAPHGIRVNAVAPGIIDTHMQDTVTPDQMEQFLKTIPLKRLGTPDEVARVILVMASDLASYVTGTNIDIDGGLNM